MVLYFNLSNSRMNVDLKQKDVFHYQDSNLNYGAQLSWLLERALHL